MKLFNTLFLMIVLISCSKNEQDISEVQMDIPPLKNLTSIEQKSLLYATADDEPTAPYAPEDLSGFDCVMVNVVGEGIGDWTVNRGKIGSGKNYSYFGTFSKMVSTATGGTVTVRIKKGSLRYIQLIGVKSTVGCPSSVSASDLKSTTKFPGLFIIGSVQKNIFQSEDVSITPTYSVNTTSDVRYEEDETVPSSIDTTAPDTSKSELTVTSTLASWTQATDEATLQKYLSYKLLRSDSFDQYNSVGKAEMAEATNIVMNWSMNKTSQTLTDLDPAKEHFFTLLVKDQFNNKSLYEIKSVPVSCTCEDGFYLKNGECVQAETGTWASSCTQNDCSNKPANSSYTTAGESTSSCAWACNNGYYPNETSTECIENSGYIALGCSANELMTGLSGRSGSILDKLGARCRTYNGTSVTGAVKNGTSFGGMGGSPFTVDCPDNKVVGEIEYINTIYASKPALGRLRLRCLNISTGVLDESWYGPFGDSEGGYTSISCPVDKFLNWISMGSSGQYTGDLSQVFGCK